MPTARLIVRSLLATVALIGGWWIGRPQWPGPPPAAASDAAAAPSPSAVRPRPGNANEDAVIATGTPPVLQDRSVSRIPAPLRERLQRRRQLTALSYDASDLHAFVQSILLAARSGDVEAQVAIANALLECAEMESSKHGPQKQTYRELLADAGTPPRLQDAARRAIGRCEALNRASPEEVGREEIWREQATRAGHGPSMLDMDAVPDSATPEEAVAEVRRAMATGDPDVLKAVLQAYLTEGNHSRWKDTADTLTRLAAITLVGCDLGEDCSNRNIDFRTSCEWSNCGETADEIGRWQAMLDARHWAEAQTLAARYIDQFYSGRDDWPEARAYEDAVRQAAREFQRNRAPATESSMRSSPTGP